MLLSEKRSLEAVRNYVAGARFLMLHSGGTEGEILRGYVLDLSAMVTVALEESNPVIHRPAVERYLAMVADSGHVTSAQFGEQALSILRSTR